MEKSKKELKAFSILVLAFVAFILIRSIVDLSLNGLPQVNEVPKGVTKGMIKTTQIIMIVVSFIFLLPQIFIGVRGLKIANGANAKGKAHMVWAIIFVLLAILSSVASIVDLVKDFNFDNSINLLSSLIDLILFGGYYVYARKVYLGK